MPESEEGQIPHPDFLPLPTALTVTHTEFVHPEQGAKGFVQVFVGTPTGVFTFFMEPEHAEQFGDNVRLHARQAKSGIEIASVMPMNGHKDA